MRDIHMSTKRFLDHVTEGYEASERYCFILGSGASITSGIPSGLNLMPKWRKYLQNKGTDYIRDCARDCGIPEGKWEPLFQEDYKLKSEDYFTLFDLRYAGKSVVAYHDLQKLMEKAEPSVGYYMLAMLMEHTENNLVITTNFDTLVEDALRLYGAKRPLMIGHESLASFLNRAENKKRPRVAKVHRDLYFQPLNREKELKELADGWKKSLKKSLSNYIPIVIGYAGGDQTLMNLLKQMEFEDGIYWCAYKGEASEPIETLLRNREHGYLVNIDGFDEVMFELAGQMIGDLEESKKPVERMRKQTERRIESYKKQYASLESKINSTVSEPVEDQNRKAEEYYIRGMSIYRLNRYKEALKELTEAVRLEPDNAQYWNIRSTTLYRLGRYEEALEDSNEAVRLEPDNAQYRDSRSATLHKLGRYEEALEDSNEAVRLEPDNELYQENRELILQKLNRK